MTTSTLNFINPIVIKENMQDLRFNDYDRIITIDHKPNMELSGVFSGIEVCEAD